MKATMETPKSVNTGNICSICRMVTLLESKGAYGRLVDKVLKRYQNNILVKFLSVN